MQSNPYTNQSPFWDFAAGFERPGNNHPFLSRFYNAEGERGEGHRPNNDNFTPNPWAAWGDFYHGRPFPHRGPPPPPGAGPEHHDEENHETVPEKDNTNEKNDEMRDAPNDNGEGPSGGSGSDNEGRGGRGRHGRCGGRRRGHCGPGGFGGPWGHRGPYHHGPGRPHHGPGHHGPRGWGGRRGGWGGWGGPWSRGFNDPSEFLAQFWNPFNDTSNNNATEDHCPDADIFDTETAYVVHVSLPGAKKEDVGVNWDANKSELSVAGVIYRPGDEEFLKTLSVDERKVGAFERKIQLGTMASPAHVDVDGIVAKLEDGVLRVEVPKLDAGYVEVRKVDVE